MEFIDSHTHLDAKEFDEDREEVIQRALDAGVTTIINIGATDGFQGAERSIALAEQHPHIWITVGIHPHDSEEELDIERLRGLASHDKVVAIGETGLDFFRDWAPVDRQYLWFRSQIELVQELSLPLVIHSRDSAEQCLEVLREMEAEKVGGVFHCYGGDVPFAHEIFDLNFIVSFPGTITFKKANELRDTVKALPLEKMMIETDAPYLAPEPYRGKRCESSYVVETAKRIAEIKEVSLEEVARVTTQTARKFYRLPGKENPQ
ncbi:MAG: TatD family hydrolase [Bdellovibrionales bacterium]|nr:TatD family hydrolase [Bdellovibrionales bacterium]